jgi:hypothetical protein
MRPGDYAPSPDSDSQAVRLVDPARCGSCGEKFGKGSWRRSFDNCTCTPGVRGHQVWWHSCGWVLTVPPHDPEHRRQTY